MPPIVEDKANANINKNDERHDKISAGVVHLASFGPRQINYSSVFSSDVPPQVSGNVTRLRLPNHWGSGSVRRAP